jgi:hypothetical protein
VCVLCFCAGVGILDVIVCMDIIIRTCTRKAQISAPRVSIFDMLTRGANICVDGRTVGHIKTNTHPQILLQQEAQGVRREGEELRSELRQSRQKQEKGCVCVQASETERGRENQHARVSGFRKCAKVLCVVLK